MKKKIGLLSAKADLAELGALTDELRARGVLLSGQYTAEGRHEAVLAVLSGAFYADGAAMDKLLSLISTGRELILPLKLDGADIPEKLMRSFAAVSIIMTEGRDPAEKTVDFSSIK